MKKFIIILTAFLLAQSTKAQSTDIDMFSRNLVYNHTISAYSIDGHPFNVDLNYSSNVPIFMLKQYWSEGASEHFKDGWWIENRTMPLWILGVNGFAIQVFQYKNLPAPIYQRILRKNDSVYNDPNTIGDILNLEHTPQGLKYINNGLDGNDFIWLVSGYDISNRMQKLKTKGDQDVIKILRSNGSVLELRNTTKYDPSLMTEFDSTLYSGYYYPNNMNDQSFAVVEIDTTWWPEYFKELAPHGAERVVFKPRTLKYYLGDGLEYVFREHIAPWGGRLLDSVKVDTNGTKLDNFFTTFYLTEINSDNANISKFEREYHKFDSTNQIFRGVPFIRKFRDHQITHGLTELNITSLERNTRIKFDTYLNNIAFPLSHEEKYINLWVDTVDVSYDFIPRKYLYEDIRTELKTPFNIWYNIYQEDKIGYPIVQQYYIRKIIDENNNEIEFTYKQRELTRTQGWLGGRTTKPTVQLMDSIFYNDKLEVIEYEEGDNEYAPGDYNSVSKELDPDLYYLVKNKKVYEKTKTGYIEQYKETYSYPNSPNDTTTLVTEKIIEDSKEGTSASAVRKFFKQVEEDPFHKHSYQSYHNPNISKFDLIKEQRYNANNSSTLDTSADGTTIIYYNYDNFKDSIGNKFNSRFQRFITNKSTYIRKASVDYPLSKMAWEYEFDYINNLDGTDSLKNSFGRLPSKITTKNYLPNRTDTNILINKREVEYIHLPYKKALTLRKDSIWNIKESIDSTLYKQFFQGKYETHLVFDVDTNDQIVTLPPIFYLTKKITIYDNNENTIGGKIYNYDTTFLEATSLTTLPQNRRGALLSDSIFGNDPNATIHLNTYGYKEGWYKSFLNEITSSEGVKSKLHYRYKGFDNDVEGTYYLNTDNTLNKKIYREYHQYEIPLVTERIIRKYNESGSLDTLSLKTIYEYNKYGQLERLIDENGYFYQNSYDKSGRPDYIWHPYDFPETEGGSNNFGGPYTFEYDCNKLFKMHTEIIRRRDSLNRLNRTIKTEQPHFNIDDQRLLIGTKYSQPVDVNPIVIDSAENNNYELITEKYKAKLSYKSIAGAPIKSTTVDSVLLVFDMAGEYLESFFHLKLKTDRFSFERRIIIGNQPHVIHDEALSANNNLQDNPELQFDLTPILDSLQNLPLNEEVEFTLESSSPDSWIEIMNPCLKLVHSNSEKKPPIYDDFTFHLKYEDTDNRVEMYSKIDDDNHTYTPNWAKTWNNKDGRYNRKDIVKGINNRTKEIMNFIGHPDNPVSVDTFSTIYSGFGGVLQEFDAYGVATNFDLDIENQVSKIINSDSSIYKRTVYFGAPADYIPAYDSTDQDFYGFCKKITSEDYKGLKNLRFYDVFGKLRINITDSASSEITTKYNYDNLGRLSNVIHHNLDTTMYWYDEFNRIKYKYKSEVGYTSYTYDQFGRLRFTQNNEQAVDQKINYYQYDDLGRATIIGEATIDTSTVDGEVAEPVYNSYNNVIFNRLTELINPDELHYSDYGVTDIGVTTLNSTIYEGSLSFSKLQIDTSACLEGSNIFDSHSNYTPPYLFHEFEFIDDSLSNFADIGDFEDIGKYPEFVRKAIAYDEFPSNNGNIWGGLPSKAFFDSLSNNVSSNSLGRPTAVAYRDSDYDELNYAIFSYDARGRVTSILRYNNNLGFDGVFYEYNSANKIIKEISADPLRQLVTWYSYDKTGRLDSIWVKLDSLNSGFGVSNLKSLSNLEQPNQCDIVFKYDRNGKTDSILYKKVNIIKNINYSNRGWVDSLIVSKSSDEILKIVFNRDVNGLINEEHNYTSDIDTLKTEYLYDDLYRLVSAEVYEGIDLVDAVGFEYDDMGNRILSGDFDYNLTYYNYGSGTNSNKLMSHYISGSPNITKLSYNLFGAVTGITDSNTSTQISSLLEEYKYLSNGKIKSFTKYIQNDSTADICSTNVTYADDVEIWAYQYNENGKLQSKRLHLSDKSDGCGNSHEWQYNKFGAFGDLKAVYNGRQFMTSCSSVNRAVYFYVDKYISGNGLIEIYPDGTKEYNIFDNNNNKRLTVREGDTLVNIYRPSPYGSGKFATSDSLPKRSFSNNHRSSENSLYHMGARLYNPDIGRFLSVDPLFESFVELTPYHYAFNNPVSFSDPSGLAPIKEKDNFTMASGNDFNVGVGSDDYNNIATLTQSWEWVEELSNPLMPGKSYWRLKVELNPLAGIDQEVGGSGGNGAPSTVFGNNYSTGGGPMTSSYKSSSFDLQKYLKQLYGASTLERGQTASNRISTIFNIRTDDINLINNFVNILNTIIDADNNYLHQPGQLENLLNQRRPIDILFMPLSDLTDLFNRRNETSADVVFGMFTPSNAYGNPQITLTSEIVEDGSSSEYGYILAGEFSTPSDNTENYTSWEVFAHEFWHYVDWLLSGPGAGPNRENKANRAVNGLRRKKGMPQEFIPPFGY